MLNIYDKKNNNDNIIYIGSSEINEIYKKINLNKKKVYVSLTTIPSRIKLQQFYNNIVSLIKNQTYIVIFRIYKRLLLWIFLQNYKIITINIKSAIFWIYIKFLDLYKRYLK